MRRLAGIILALAALGAAYAQARPSEEEKIEAVIAAVVEAYSSGDYAAMRKYYSPDVTMVPANYRPPLVGWDKVEERYRRAYENMTVAQMIRENTRIERRGNIAWAVYQWRFVGVMGGQAFSALGHTTLILEKHGGNWKIVHNHTSALPGPPPQEQAAPTETPPESEPPPAREPDPQYNFW
ncbi:MAG: YybH family protein [Terriglobia bacterium]